MRKFTCSFHGNEVDLDDPKTYKQLPDNIKELRQLMLSEIGYTYCYMNFWHKDIFGDKDGGQRSRIDSLVEDFTKNERHHYDDVMWYQEQIFMFHDENENMC